MADSRRPTAAELDEIRALSAAWSRRRAGTGMSDGMSLAALVPYLLAEIDALNAELSATRDYLADEQFTELTGVSVGDAGDG